MSFWKNRPLLIAVILIIILFVLLFATAGTSGEGGTQSVIGGIFAPMQEGLYNFTASIGDFFSNLFSTTDLDKENLELKQKVAELESKLQDYENIASENERLKELLNVVDSVGDYEIVTARVIGKNPGVWFREFTINAGRNQGVEKDMIVLTKDGLMGRVISSADSYAKVMTLIDLESGVPALVERTRQNGVVKLKGGIEDSGDALEMYYLPIDAAVVPGDKILTSGIGGVYPKGLIIGTVTEVSAESGTEKRVTVKSAVDFERMEEVMVIKHVFEEVEE